MADNEINETTQSDMWPIGATVVFTEEAVTEWNSHEGRTPLYEGEGTVINPPTQIAHANITLRCVQWGNGKTTLTDATKLVTTVWPVVNPAE